LILSFFIIQYHTFDFRICIYLTMIPTIIYFNKILIDTLKVKESFVDIFEDKAEIIYNFVICSIDISTYKSIS
jgi:hypothetical protein